MGAWRGWVLCCSLALGCGGPLPEESDPEDERSQEGSPSSREDGELSAQGGRLELGRARLVEDLFPPVAGPPWWGPYPESLVEFRGRLFFAANFEDGRRGLWKSNGNGTDVLPVKEFPAAPGEAFSRALGELTPLGSRLFFVVGDEAHGRELWVSDGSSGGTRLVRDITPGPEHSHPYNLTATRKRLLFFRYVPGTPPLPDRTELWKSDGTAAGTARVKDLGPDSALIFSQALVGDTLFFVFSTPAHGTELWKSDGTEAGTALVKDIVPGADSAYPFHLRAVGRHVFFTATEPTHGTEVWRSDGTEAGTELVVDLTPGPDSDNPTLLGPIGSCLYATTSRPADHLMRLYRLKEDDAGSVHVRHVATLPNPYAGEPDAAPFITTSAVAGKRLFLAVGISSSGPAPRDVQLWVTDGTKSGTKLLHRPLSLYDEFGTQLYALDNRVLFSGAADVADLEPWISDGTVKGTRRLQDIAPGAASSFPRSFTRVGSRVFFVANDGVHGNELWAFPPRRSHLAAEE
jgi:ELWxxDGT repeat protein